MRAITEKRESLVRFIKEQLLGPGGTRYRFVDIATPTEEGRAAPLMYTNELINSAPGALYSTGMLFPEDGTRSSQPGTEPHQDKEEQDEDQELDEDREQDENQEQDEDQELDEEAYTLNQMYPNTMGFTCCLSENITADNDLRIHIYARHYCRIAREELKGRYGVLLEQDIKIFEEFFQQLPEDGELKKLLRIEKKGIDHVLLLSELPSKDAPKSIRGSIKSLAAALARQLGAREGQHLSGYKEYLFNGLKTKVPAGRERSEIAEKLEKIESFESFKAHIDDLLGLFEPMGYGLWKSEPIEVEVPLAFDIPINITGKKILSYRDTKGFKGVWNKGHSDGTQASLSINLQFSKDSRVDKGSVFLKVQLMNTSTTFTPDANGSRYYSAFNEKVNQRTFFGVRIRVTSKHLEPYRGLKNERATKSMDAAFGEDAINRYLYRQYEDYAVGHGCSVAWGDELKDGQKVKFVESEYIPAFDTPDVDSIPRRKEEIVRKDGIERPAPFLEDTKPLQFKWLSTFSSASDAEVLAGLERLVKSYGDWINNERKNREHPIGEHLLLNCERDKIRMAENITELLSGPANAHNLRAFRLMNSAMFMQLWHATKVKKNVVHEHLSRPDFKMFDKEFYKSVDDNLFERNVSAAWRPFQLAFILLNLDGIFRRTGDAEWQARNDWVDLVWFPTGGGKTEAYLGLIALTIINRRVKHREQGGGTAVLMRYTLRMLTSEQFQRATLVVMALELIRRWGQDELGQEPIYIGLWVGRGSLPNKLKELEKEYKKIDESQREGKVNISTKIPFTKCPWCGHVLDPINFESVSNPKKVFLYNRVVLRCSRDDHKCSFAAPSKASARTDHGPIPVSLCDEEIYQHPPALLFGTVDKFAQLAHKISTKTNDRQNDSRRLFGRGNWESGKPSGYLPPDLIIQDELHLLSGPLGSAVALFESAIDQLCTRTENGKIIRPKIISSTATTRNTPLQIMALFDRKVNLFPKPGTACDDSFFAFYRREAEEPDWEMKYVSKRRYLGILPTGKTHIWMQMRLIAIFLTHRALFESKHLEGVSPLDPTAYADDDLKKAIDHYHTILSYFNSLKEVGKTESQIQTYIIKDVRRVFNRVLRPGKLMHGMYSYNISGSELTGRLSGEEVVKEKEKVSARWSHLHRFAHLDEKNIVRAGHLPPDVVVATNMNSVGIDISRFNTIIMNSMPRNIAEYIQASSRVARETPGLVITVHHPFRTRDVSHYERFIEFHEKMYSHVEPISITPFTKKALQRYLGLYFVTVLRHFDGPFTDRISADVIQRLSQQQKDSMKAHLMNYFRSRQQRLALMDISDIIKNLLTQESLENIQTWIDGAVQAWEAECIKVLKENRAFVFNNASGNTKPPQSQLYINIDEYEDNVHDEKWQIPQSLRVVESEAIINIKPV